MERSRAISLNVDVKWPCLKLNARDGLRGTLPYSALCICEAAEVAVNARVLLDPHKALLKQAQ